MNWKTITGIIPSDVHYEATPQTGVQLRVEPIIMGEWPAFRWSVDINIEGHRLYENEVAVDLSAAKHAAENFVALTLSVLQNH